MKGARFGLRWFTPTNEVPLCGHATLASAAVLFYLKSKKHLFLHLIFNQRQRTVTILKAQYRHTENVNPVLAFETMSGELYVRQHEESLIMDFPLNKPNPQV